MATVTAPMVTVAQLSQLSDRKLRLFACACARSVQDLLTDFRSWEAVKVAERFADGAATEADRGKASASAPWAFGNALVTIGAICASTNGAYTHALLSWLSNTPACPAAAILDDLWPTRECERCKGKGVANVGWDSGDLKCRDCHGSGRIAFQPSLCGQQCHDGLSYRCCRCKKEFRHINKYSDCDSVGCEGEQSDRIECKCASILAFNNRLIPAMTQHIYDTRDFALMPILADALEEAGACSEVVEHCRSSRECKWCHEHARKEDAERGYLGYFGFGCNEKHVDSPDSGRLPAIHARGCWVLDLILGKS